MRQISVNYFRKHLKAEIDRCIAEQDVLYVKHRDGENFVVLSEDNWNTIAETLHLNQLPDTVSSDRQTHPEHIGMGLGKT